jgi:hypothetical protein
MGLALRGDRRVIPIISNELASDWVGCSVIEAATAIPDAQFYPLLLAIREAAFREPSDASDESTKMWQMSEIDEAIEACRPLVPCDEQQSCDS